MSGKPIVAGIWQTFCKPGRFADGTAYAKRFITVSLLNVLDWTGLKAHTPVPADDTAARQAQQMEALGRLTGGVAHDFNNLLTVVLGNAAALRVQAEARGDAKTVQRAEVIERAAERGGRLAGQLLAFSRKQMLRPEIVSVYRVISATHELLARAAGENARVRLRGETGLWNCLVDPGQLESAVLNLVLNARDAIAIDGNITISCCNTRILPVKTGKSPKVPGDYVRIDVSDDGAGIPAELHEKVFEPFFTTKPIGQGSGLGLAQVHGFCGQSGGWVELASTVTVGTTVSVFLPRACGPESEPLPKTDGTVPVGNDRAVLVVEPDLDRRMTTCETLIRAGYRAVGVANGKGAVAMLASAEPIDALLIADQLADGVSGVALARGARKLRQDLCVLITTDQSHKGLSDPGQRIEFVTKPPRVTDLARVLGAALTASTFSMETEQLLAEAKTSVADMVPLVTSAISTPAALGRKDTIRLGVMPFRAIGPSGDAAFSIGLAEEITTAFARFRWITCLSPASVATLSDEPLEAGRWGVLGLDFLVQGSFRRKGNEIRVVLRLINMGSSGEMIWGRRFDGLLPDVLNLQDQIASETAARMGPELLVWEARDTRSRPQVDPDAYDLMLRAIPAIYRLDDLGFREAGLLLERSLALDPSSAACHSWLAHWYLFSLGQGWAVDIALAVRRAEELSERAVALDPGDARGYSVAGHVRAFLKKDAAGALALHDHAIALNANLALAWCYSGLAHSYVGQHEEAIRRIQHARRLSPFDPHGFFFDMALALPLLLTQQYEAAAGIARQARERHPGLSSTQKLLLACLGYLGASREAAVIRRELLVLEPGFSISEGIARSPLTQRADLDRYAEGLRLAGIPERSRGRSSQVFA